MPRIRSIKPEFFRNEQLAELPYEDRLLFIGLWTQADRDGRLEDRPKRLKGELFAYDDLNVEAGLGRLANAGLIVRYEVNSQRLIVIPTWAKHQRPHHTEGASTLPPPNGLGITNTVSPPSEHRDAPLGREWKGIDQERKGSTALRASFELWWSVYPRKVGKDAALAQWLRIQPDYELVEAMTVAVQHQSSSPQWKKDGGQFVPHPRTWLSQGRWKDSVDLVDETKHSAEAKRTADLTRQYTEHWAKKQREQAS